MKLTIGAALCGTTALVVIGVASVFTYQLASAAPATSTPATGTVISGSSGAAGSSKPNDNGNKPESAGHALTVVFSIDKQLSPGSSATVSALVGNPNNQAVLITDVSGVVDAVDKAGCSTTWLTLTAFHSSPGRSIGINGQSTFLLPTHLDVRAPDACKGAHWHVALTAQGRQA